MLIMPDNLSAGLESLANTVMWLHEAVDHGVISRDEAIASMNTIKFSAGITVYPEQADSLSEFIDSVISSLGS